MYWSDVSSRDELEREGGPKGCFRERLQKRLPAVGGPFLAVTNRHGGRWGQTHAVGRAGMRLGGGGGRGGANHLDWLR